MDIRKLQRAIVDGLEDVKAQDIVVFNTEKLSPLFERVVVASGTSNRQTKALASSVREAVKSAGGQVLSVEGEDNGEWIIVDCGAAVAHIMQPAIRQYYHLEEIWGGKPVRMKLGASAARGLPKASAAEAVDEEDDVGEAVELLDKPARPARPRRSGSAAEARAPARKAAGEPTSRAAAKKVARKTAAGTPAKKAARKSPRPVEAPVETVIVQPTRKSPARKATGRTSGNAPGTPARKAPARKSATRPAAKAPARKTAARG
ncbi:MAG: ribosome silencing factor [Burkholderiaceae bacterium]|nr:ribosome silencing factor [Burkholderiaceae bacterium]